ncbi:MAG: hypothetical protein E6J99_01090 [Methanobacteriota archaeon]|nr:MAG: hypothetical protein E6J99_01090 [Euryarchaeota archaeon]
MRFLVASEADEASLSQRDELLGLESWKDEDPFGGRPAWRLRDLILLTIPEPHLDRDHLDRDLESGFQEPADLVVYLSKHRSESGRPSLTVHPIGNPGAAEFGGQPQTLVPSAPRWMTAALHRARQHGAGMAGPRGLARHRSGPPRPEPDRWADRDRHRRRALRAAAYGPRAAEAHRVRTSPRDLCNDLELARTARPGRRADGRGDPRLRASQGPRETGGAGDRETTRLPRPSHCPGGRPPVGSRGRNFIKRWRIPNNRRKGRCSRNVVLTDTSGRNSVRTAAVKGSSC